MSSLDNDGDTTEVWGSGSKPYKLKNVGGVLSCSCPAWRNQSLSIDLRTCKHVIGEQGVEVERARVGDANMPTKFKKGTGAGPAKRTPKAAASAARKASPAASGAAAGGSPALLLAQRWEPDVDPTGWWLSEKLDGVRAYWDGAQFLSRNGNVFHAPDWFRKHLPRLPLDGELWIGRQEFQKTISVVRRHDGGDQWKDVQYVVFDAPEAEGTFKQRLSYLHDWFSSVGPPHARLHPHALCEGMEELKEELERVLAAGGEGLMLRKAGSLYEGRRSHTLLKVKVFKEAEATLISIVPGRGKHEGRMGGMVLQMPDGKTFNVGTGMKDHERESPPPIGSKITYRYTEHTKDGIPKCASFVAVRDYE